MFVPVEYSFDKALRKSLALDFGNEDEIIVVWVAQVVMLLRTACRIEVETMKYVFIWTILTDF